MKRFHLLAGVAAMLAGSGPLAAEGSASASGWEYAAVNGTTISCPVPVPPSAEQQATQFETAPRDLDELSRGAQEFFSADSEIGAAFRARQAEMFATDWPFLCRYRDANAALKESGKRPRAVFMGDSITEGWIVADPQFFSENGFVDRGISGQSSAQMVARFQHDVVALSPEAVHIMAGTNDIGGATGPITEEEFLGNIRAMVALARANGIEVVLAAIPPMSRLLPRPDFDTRPVVRRLNAALAALARERGIEFVDYYTPLAEESGDFDPAFANDGVHPTRAGYDVMEPLARAAVEAVLEAGGQ